MAITLLYPVDQSSVPSTTTYIYQSDDNDPHKKVDIVVDGVAYEVHEDYMSCGVNTCEFSYTLPQGTNDVYLQQEGSTTDTVTITSGAPTGGGTGGGELSGMVTLDPDASIDISTGMTVEQMTQIGGAVVLTLAVAVSYRILKDFLFNRR